MLLGFAGKGAAGEIGEAFVSPSDRHPASGSAQIVGNVLHLTFCIPREADGVDGTDGTNGGPGPQCPQCLPFANALIGGGSTPNPGDNARVATMFDGTNVTFCFGMPRR